MSVQPTSKPRFCPSGPLFLSFLYWSWDVRAGHSTRDVRGERVHVGSLLLCGSVSELELRYYFDKTAAPILNYQLCL